MKYPKISVIIPVYQVEAYLEKCVASLLAQTFSDFEMILVDDGATDGSGQLCDQLAQEDARIRVVHQKNAGLSAARNSGIAIARGEFITLVDSDDAVTPEYLRHLYDGVTLSGAEVCVCGFAYVFENPAEAPKTRFSPRAAKKEETCCMSGRQAAARIVKDNDRGMIVAWGKLYHRSLLPYLHYPEGKLNEDEFTTYQVLYHAGKVAILAAKDYLYLQRKGSIMGGGYHERRLDKLEALRQAIGFFQEKGEEELQRAAEKRYLLSLQIAWYRVRRNLPNRGDLLQNLRREHRRFFGEHKVKILPQLSVTERLSLLLFRIHPGLYAAFSDLYLKLFPQA